jgi:hypothetical protein
MENYLLTILSILMGMLIAAVTARKYYQKASEDLKKEAKQLRHLNELMLRVRWTPLFGQSAKQVKLSFR